MPRRVPKMALLVLAVSLLCWGFLEFAEKVMTGETEKFDQWVRDAFRNRDHEEYVPLGNRWTMEAGRDITALGGRAVLTVLVTIIAVYFLLKRQYALVALILLSVIGGAIFSTSLKYFFVRERPSNFSSTVWTTSPSFPSGHASLSAILYLTLGALLARHERKRWQKIYVLTVAVGLTFLVGLSRIYLGIHYATDVLAGWAVGTTWAALTWIVAVRWLPATEPPT